MEPHTKRSRRIANRKSAVNNNAADSMGPDNQSTDPNTAASRGPNTAIIHTIRDCIRQELQTVVRSVVQEMQASSLQAHVSTNRAENMPITSSTQTTPAAAPTTTETPTSEVNQPSTSSAPTLASPQSLALQALTDRGDKGSFSDNIYDESSISEVKRKIKHNWDQTVAQTIVFAFAQRQLNLCSRTFIPNILICQKQFYIIMYDPDYDILIWSGGFNLWSGLSPTTLNRHAVITLWMVLHYKLFCSSGDIFENVDEVKAEFLDHIRDGQKEYYEQLAIGVSNFETEETTVDFLTRGHSVSDMFEIVKVKLKK